MISPGIPGLSCQTMHFCGEIIFLLLSVIILHENILTNRGIGLFVREITHGLFAVLGLPNTAIKCWYISCCDLTICVKYSFMPKAGWSSLTVGSGTSSVRAVVQSSKAYHLMLLC